MAKLESTFKNMAISLVTIAVVAGAALAGVFTMTKDKIDEQKAEKVNKAILDVLPNKGVDAIVAPADTIDKAKDLIVYRAYSDSTFSEEAYIGAAVKTSANGFGGKFKIMVGFDAENLIVNYSVLEHQETPGLGDKMRFWFNDTTKTKSCILGRKAGALKVSKDQGGDVDAITAATISSRYFLGAVNDAYATISKEEVQAATSASQQQHEVAKEEVEPKEEEAKEEVEQQQEKEEGHE